MNTQNKDLPIAEENKINLKIVLEIYSWSYLDLARSGSSIDRVAVSKQNFNVFSVLKIWSCCRLAAVLWNIILLHDPVSVKC